MTVLVLFALASYQVTTATAATRLLGRVGAALVELDRWLPAHREDIQLLASDKPQSAVRINDLPIDVTLPQAIMASADEPVLRATIVRVMGRNLYIEGSGAFRDDQGKQHHLAITEPVRWTISLLDRGAHSFWKAALPLSLLLLVAVAAGALMHGSSPAPPMIFGAGFAAVVSAGSYLLLGAASRLFDGAIDKELALVYRDWAWISVRDSLGVVVIGVTLLFISSMIGRQHDGGYADTPRRPRSDAEPDWGP